MEKEKESGSSAFQKRGRKKTGDPRIYRYTLKLNRADNEKFLRLFELSNLQTKAYFLYHCVFNKPIPVFTVDRHAESLLGELENFNRQYRNIGVNYNQVVAKINRSGLNPENARYYFLQLEILTVELISISQKML